MVIYVLGKTMLYGFYKNILDIVKVLHQKEFDITRRPQHKQGKERNNDNKHAMK